MMLWLASIAAAASPVPPPSLAEAIEICRTTFFINPAKGKMMFEAVPDEHKQSVALICIAYKQGILDLIEVSKSKPHVEQVQWAR